jgi:hypothetical protein
VDAAALKGAAQPIKITKALKRRRRQPSQSRLLLIVIINTFTGIHRRALIIRFTSACDAFIAISFCQFQKKTSTPFCGEISGEFEDEDDQFTATAPNASLVE